MPNGTLEQDVRATRDSVDTEFGEGTWQRLYDLALTYPIELRKTSSEFIGGTKGWPLYVYGAATEVELLCMLRVMIIGGFCDELRKGQQPKPFKE